MNVRVYKATVVWRVSCGVSVVIGGRQTVLQSTMNKGVIYGAIDAMSSTYTAIFFLMHVHKRK